MIDLLEQLADTNISGAPFLIAYGLTWLICGMMWRKTKQSYAALATLFQGMIALPIALIIMNGIGAFAKRPGTKDLDPLAILIAMSQLLALPLLMVLYHKKQYSLIPFIFTTAGAIHFLIYTWFYQSFAYLSLSVLIALAVAIIYLRHSDADNGKPSSLGASHICLASGFLMLAHALFLVASHRF